MLTIATVQSSDQGNYDCIVSNICGSVLSATVDLSCRPIVTAQPPPSSILAPGLRLTIGVPTGASYTYRWRQNGQNLFNFPGFFAGVTTRTLRILAVDPSLVGSYDCVLTSSCGTTESLTTDVFEPPPCPADFNEDGGVDGGDVEAFFTEWSAGESRADVNRDGGVDGSDVEVFFVAWEAGEC